jgi:hypothetical protein
MDISAEGKRARLLDEKAWDRAINEVAASMLSDQIRVCRKYQTPPETVVEAVRGWLPGAKKELGAHKADDIDCLCRHKALLMANAVQVARLTRTQVGVQFDAMFSMLEAYLARRS